MSTDEIITLFDRTIEAFNNVEDRTGYFELYAEDAVLHNFPPEFEPNLEGAKRFYRYFWSAFPDGQVTVDDRVVEGDRLAYRYTWRATHAGEFFGATPTGKPITVKGMTFLHFADGKCVERWQGLDEVGLLRQLGLMPS